MGLSLGFVLFFGPVTGCEDAPEPAPVAHATVTPASAPPPAAPASPVTPPVEIVDATPFVADSASHLVKKCEVPGFTLPPDAVVYAAGAYNGRELDYEIDASDSVAGTIDVVVNHPGAPVVLLLGAYDPTIWTVGWTASTRLAAVVVAGYERQLMLGLPRDVPVLISQYDGGPCEDGFYVRDPREEDEERAGQEEMLADLERVDAARAKRVRAALAHSPAMDDESDGANVFAKKRLGWTVTATFPAREGRVVAGEALPAGAAVEHAPMPELSSLRRPGRPLAGRAGLRAGVAAGALRHATEADLAAWNQGASRKMTFDDLLNPYVVLKPFVIPAGLHGGDGATFIVPQGVASPRGELWSSTVLETDGHVCRGGMCHGESGEE